MIWLILAVAVALLIYWKVIKPFGSGNIKGVRYVPLFDRPWDVLNPFLYTERLIYLYHKYPKDRYTGIYQVFSRRLMIKDLDLIRNVMVKDFEHFTDHTQLIPEPEDDPLWAKNLFSLTGQKWKNMRSTLSPAFTSSKMKAMFQLMTACSEQFAEHFEKEDSALINVDLKEILTRYATDIIGTCAFGIQTNSMEQKENEFFMMGQEFSKIRSLKTNLKFAMNLAFPSMSKIIKISFFGKIFYDFFPKLIEDTIKLRREKNIYRPDMIHLLMEAQKGKLKYEEDSNSTGFATVTESNIGIPQEPIKQEITLMDMTSQALLFFLGGFDSISTMMAFMAYELALAPDVQERLYREIEKTMEECEGKISYDVLNKMKYLDMVISETLRKYPMAVGTDRICTKNYTIPPEREGEVEINLKVGDIVIIPIVPIHYNPEYFPNPYKFDPERFSDENKANIKPFMYMPFGAGPRNCIGSRFALLEAKAMFVYLLRKFEIAPNKNTPIPMHLRKDTFPLMPKEDLVVDLKKRAY